MPRKLYLGCCDVACVKETERPNDRYGTRTHTLTRTLIKNNNNNGKPAAAIGHISFCLAVVALRFTFQCVNESLSDMNYRKLSAIPEHHRWAECIYSVSFFVVALWPYSAHSAHPISNVSYFVCCRTSPFDGKKGNQHAASGLYSHDG